MNIKFRMPKTGRIKKGSGNKIELRKTEVNDDGEEETSVSHMVRQKK